MKTVIIHGQSHKGSTYHIAHMLAEKVGGDLTEFFLPRDFGAFCTGCTACFMKDERLCPHYKDLFPITKVMDEADLLILASPVYVYHATGPMKSFLDHYGYRWMVHRPDEAMFSKQAVCISTAAGGGMKATNRDMADSLFYWGVPKIYRYGVAVRATSYGRISEKTKLKIDQKTTRLAASILKNKDSVTPGFKTKVFFAFVGWMQKKGWNEADRLYWQQKGWTTGKRPWK